jgi:hypothetical protein
MARDVGGNAGMGMCSATGGNSWEGSSERADDDSEAEWLSNDDERKGRNCEQDSEAIEMARLLDRVLTDVFQFLPMEKDLTTQLELLLLYTDVFSRVKEDDAWVVNQPGVVFTRSSELFRSNHPYY